MTYQTSDEYKAWKASPTGQHYVRAGRTLSASLQRLHAQGKSKGRTLKKKEEKPIDLEAEVTKISEELNNTVRITFKGDDKKLLEIIRTTAKDERRSLEAEILHNLESRYLKNPIIRQVQFGKKAKVFLKTLRDYLSGSVDHDQLLEELEEIEGDQHDV